MPIFKIEKQKAQQLSLKRDGFGDEFKLRDFFADNLEEILGVRFLEKEYQIPGGRIDTLGLDENNSPVIIEYKWKENEDVLSQGLFYLDWLVKNKPHFKLLVKSKLGEKVEVNWDQPRVILIAQGFNRYIMSAVQRVGGVELKTYTLYDGNVLHIENKYSPVSEKEPAEKKNAKDKPARKGEYDLNYHLNITSINIQTSFNKLRDQILKLPSVEERVSQKSGITYRTTKSFTRLEFRRTWIQVLLRDAKYAEDKKGIVKDVSTFGWGFLGMVKLTRETDLNVLFSLIKASYDSTL